MTIDELKQLYNMVWTFRAEMKDDFPTPPPGDALLFAFTEIAEAIDAQLRKNPLYKRNNDKAHTVERELTQCAMMLLTALPDIDQVELARVHPNLNWEMKNIAYRIGAILDGDRTDAYIAHTVIAINSIVKLSETLPAELDRMRAKHKSSSSESIPDVVLVGVL